MGDAVGALTGGTNGEQNLDLDAYALLVRASDGAAVVADTAEDC